MLAAPTKNPPKRAPPDLLNKESSAGLDFACSRLAVAAVPAEAGGPHRGGHEPQQILAQDLADVFDVVGRESDLVTEPLRDVALRTIGLDSQLINQQMGKL